MTLDDVTRRHEPIWSDRFTFLRVDESWSTMVDDVLTRLRMVAPDAKVTVVKEKCGRLVIYVEDKSDVRAREFLRNIEAETAPPEERLS